MITALIPARAGSRRIKDKNSRKLDGRPLFLWSADVARACRLIDYVVVSSDSERILDMATGEGINTRRRRPEAASDTATDEDVLYDWLSGETRPVGADDLLVYLRPTTPFRRLAWVEEAITSFIAAKHASGLRSVQEMDESAFKCFRMDPSGRLMTLLGGDDVDMANLPNDSYAKTYRANGAVDIVRLEDLRDSGKMYGNFCMAYLTPATVEIDTPANWAYAEFQAAKNGGVLNVYSY